MNKELGIMGSGFTLVELMLVMGLVAILSGFGISAAVKYSRAQNVDVSARNFANTLQTAKSRAFAGVRPTGCSGVLLDWRVNIAADYKHYSLSGNCSGGIINSPTVTLATGVEMTRPVDSVIYPVLKGSATLGTAQLASPQQIFFTSSSGLTRNVTVYDDARISVH